MEQGIEELIKFFTDVLVDETCEKCREAHAAALAEVAKNLARARHLKIS